MSSIEEIYELFTGDNINISEKCAALPSELQPGDKLPEQFIRHALTHIGRVKGQSVIDDSVEYINSAETGKGISDFKPNFRAAIYKNRDFVHVLYRLLVATSGSLVNERKMTPLTIELILFLSNARARTAVTIDKKRKALYLYFIGGESVTEVSFQTNIAKPNVSREIKRTKEKLVLANHLLALLLGERVKLES